MRVLLSYLTLYKDHKKMLLFAITIAVITILANIGLLTLSSWFLSISAIESAAGIYDFNYILPAVGIRSAAIIRTSGRYFERLVNHNITFRILQYLRVDIFSKMLPLSPAKLIRFRQGDLLNRMIADIDTLNHLYLRTLSPIVVSFTVAIIVLLWLSILNITISLILATALVATLFMLPLLFFRTGKLIGKNLINLRSEYRQKLTMWLQGQAELIIFGANQHYRLHMENTELNWYKAQCSQSKLIAFSQALLMLITNLVMLIILWVSANSTNGNHQSRALIAVYTFCTLSTFEVLFPIINALQYFGQVLASSLRINQIIRQNPEVQFSGNYSIKPSRVSLHLDCVSFTYNRYLQNTLNKVTLYVKRGTHVAVLGRTGCGKSTLLQLITRAWDPQQGSIKINNIPLSQFDEQTLRTTISMVPQRTYLFSSTLRDNLLLSSSSIIDDKKLCFVLEQVGLSKLLDHDGINSWFGEGGRQLSAGELRRLAIARILLHDAPLILLDEPTSGLDVITEAQILDLLTKVMYDRTVLMVTHSLCGLVNFDNIVVMDNGKIIEQAKYSELSIKKYFHRCLNNI